MLTATGFLIIAAFVCTVLSAAGKCPLWVAVLFLVLVHLLSVLPK